MWQLSAFTPAYVRYIRSFQAMLHCVQINLAMASFRTRLQNSNHQIRFPVTRNFFSLSMLRQCILVGLSWLLACPLITRTVEKLNSSLVYPRFRRARSSVGNLPMRQRAKNLEFCVSRMNFKLYSLRQLLWSDVKAMSYVIIIKKRGMYWLWLPYCSDSDLPWELPKW